MRLAKFHSQSTILDLGHRFLTEEKRDINPLNENKEDMDREKKGRAIEIT